MKISVIGGAGYVGLITALGASSMGHEVIATDINEKKVKNLKINLSPIYEDNLDSLLKFCNSHNKITFTTNSNDAIKNSDLVIVSVGTPTKINGEIDLSQVEMVTEYLKDSINNYTLIVIKSTLPITAVNLMKKELDQKFKSGIDYDIISNPEFLREGRAVHDFYNPDRIVIGGESKKSINILKEFYLPLIIRNLNIPNNIHISDEEIPIVETNLPSAQMIKYGSNAFLANKISFINEIAQICESVDADVNDVIFGMGIDPRIGKNYMQPGPGFGGPCLEKDLTALVELGNHFELESTFMKAILERNERQVELIFKKITKELNDNSVITILGLSFKADTDDIRNSASVKLVDMLIEKGYEVRSYDPKAKYILKEKKYTQYDELYTSLETSNCIVIMTEWNEFIDIDLNKVYELMDEKFIFDMRNILDKNDERLDNFNYFGLGN